MVCSRVFPLSPGCNGTFCIALWFAGRSASSSSSAAAASSSSNSNSNKFYSTLYTTHSTAQHSIQHNTTNHNYKYIGYKNKPAGFSSGGCRQMWQWCDPSLNLQLLSDRRTLNSLGYLRFMLVSGYWFEVLCCVTGLIRSFVSEFRRTVNASFQVWADVGKEIVNLS